LQQLEYQHSVFDCLGFTPRRTCHYFPVA
jgi:hypothetical protein